MIEPEEPEPEAIELPIEDSIDLHSFPPAQVADVVREWLLQVQARGWREVRVIHGRGIGVQREIVRSVLAADPHVETFGDAGSEAGGWGATWVRLRSPQTFSEAPVP